MPDEQQFPKNALPGVFFGIVYPSDVAANFSQP
jgi:hypothetical protein